jgi:hypothetical protein
MITGELWIFLTTLTQLVLMQFPPMQAISYGYIAPVRLVSLQPVHLGIY